MLNISKYQKAVVVSCTAIATASFTGWMPSVNATEGVETKLPAVQKTLLIADNVNSNGSGSNTSGSNTTGSNTTGSSNGRRGGSNGYSSDTSVRAGNVLGRYNLALSNYERAAAALAQAEAAQKNVSNSPVRYGRENQDLASCGCPNSDTVGSSGTDSPELIAARQAEAEAAAELAKAKAEAQAFLDTVKNDPGTSTASTVIW